MSIVTELALRQVNSLVVVVNAQGNVEYVSPSVRRILGFEPEQLLGQGWWQLTRDNAKDRKLLRRFVDEQLQQTEITDTRPQERLLKTASGGEKWILWSTSKGFLNKLVAIGQDITEQKTAGQRLEKNFPELRQQNSDILASIRYAGQIQKTILPGEEKIRAAFADAFVFYQPRDVVSGDFYFFHQQGNQRILVAADCTGHGVPGALMTMIANSILKEVIVKRGLRHPAEILSVVDQELFIALQNDENRDTTSDGMDLSVAVFDSEKNTLHYAGAFRPLLLVREKEIIELEANRFPIGFYGDVPKTFTAQEIQLLPGDTFYFFTDGFCDQFGGERKKKFNRQRFRDLLLSIQGMPGDEQKSFIRYALRNWQQDEQQVDDILVMGVQV